MQGEELTKYGLRSIVGLCLLNTVRRSQLSGMSNIWGVIMVYAASYLHLYDSNSNVCNLAMAFAAQGFFWTLGVCNRHVGASLRFSPRLSSRFVLGVGLGILVLPILIASFLTSLCPFLALYFMAAGLGSSLICTNSLRLSKVWCPQRPELAASLILSFNAISSAIQSLLIGVLVNPDNQSPDLIINVGSQALSLYSSQIARRLPMALRVLAGLCAAVGILALLMIKDGSRPGTNQIVQAEAKPSSPQKCPSLSAALHTSSFYLLLVLTYAAYSFVGFFLLQYKNYAMTVYKNDLYQTLIAAFAFLFSAVSRLFTPLLARYLSFRQIVVVAMAMETGLAVTLHWIVEWGWVMAVWMSAALMGLAAVNSAIIRVCDEIYGSA